MGISLADIIIISVILVSAMISLLRGFVREALSLLSWVIAFWVAINFSHAFSELLTHWITSHPLRNIVAFLVLFIATLILGSLINYLMGQLIDRVGLATFDRVLGVFFGVLRGGLLVAVLLLVGSLTSLPQKEWWQSSSLIPRFQPVEVWLKEFMPESANGNMELSLED